MLLDLREMIEVPGRSASFSYEPDFSDLQFDSVLGWPAPVRAEGTVTNTAGLLELRGELTGVMTCQCARCLREFDRELRLPLTATLTDTPDQEREDDPELFVLTGDRLDLDEVTETALILNMEQRFLCRPDCRGLCPRCGKDLNDGPCDCGADPDPRLAVLMQLLEKQK